MISQTAAVKDGYFAKNPDIKPGTEKGAVMDKLSKLIKTELEEAGLDFGSAVMGISGGLICICLLLATVS